MNAEVATAKELWTVEYEWQGRNYRTVIEAPTETDAVLLFQKFYPFLHVLRCWR